MPNNINKVGQPSGLPAVHGSPSSDTPETDEIGSMRRTVQEWRNLCEKLERERDAAVRIIEQIEERYIDGCDTYEDWKFMGNAARNFLYPENSNFTQPSCDKQ
jgi:hypothetical protein